MDIKWKSLTSKERRYKEARIIIILVETGVYHANTSCNIMQMQMSQIGSVHILSPRETHVCTSLICKVDTV